MGKAPSRVRELKATGHKVHRIKVDENVGIVVTTHRDGGLLVTDIKGDELLWSLPDVIIVFCFRSSSPFDATLSIDLCTATSPL
jgi:hypothetical protein